jgi:hypothetical protein
MVAGASGASGYAQVRVNGVGYLYSGSMTTVGQYAQWTGRQVVNSGEQLVATAGVVSVTFLASGYVFPTG